MKFLVPAPQKIVSFLQHSLPEECSGKMVRRLLEANLCRVNGRTERFGSTWLQKGDIVELAPSWKSVSSPQLSPHFKMLYEDSELLLVDKPVGWVCSEENCRRTFGPRLQLIHRLDKDTTGVLALAKSSKVRKKWMQRFAKREVEKEYLAIVDGIPKEETGKRESKLVKKREFEGQTIWGSGKKGVHAVTYWKRLAQGVDASLLLCHPWTGRTHQIRVHLAEMGHPILVDRQYAATFRCPLFARRPLLHAFRLRWESTLGEAPLPLDMWNILFDLGVEESHLRQLFGREQKGDSREEGDDEEPAEKTEQVVHLAQQTRERSSPERGRPTCQNSIAYHVENRA